MSTLKEIDYTKFVEPHFKFNELKAEDLRDDDPNWKDPWSRLRRPLDPKKLQQIYQQAYIYDLLYRFAQENLPKKAEDISQSSLNKATDTKIDSIKDKVLDYLFKNDFKVDVDEKKAIEVEVRTDGSKSEDNLWDTEDLVILRKEFKRVKEENFALKTRLAIANEEIKTLYEKYEKSIIETKSLPDEVRSLEKANQRMYVRIQEVEKSYKANLDEMFELDKACKQAREEAAQGRKKCQGLLNEKSRLEYELQKYEFGASKIKRELRLEFKEKLEAQRLKMLKEINSFAKQNSVVSRELQDEKTEHERCKKALEQLRIHFMSVSLSQSNLNDRIDDSKLQMI
jgi:hypothetical protein